MISLARRLLVVLLGVVLLLGPVGVGRAGLAAAEEADGADYAPPRLSFVDGEVSFWRPGAEDWAPAQVNTPLAPGDELHTGYRGNLEMQLGGQAFVRAWGDTHLGVTDQRPETLQLKVTAGHVALDLRRMEPGVTVEVDAPHGALVLDAPGYYRLDVGPQRTAFTLRRGARATLALADGAPLSVGAGEQVILDGATVQRAAAPAVDVWDTWNEARTAHLLAPAAAQYVASGVAGVSDLDRYGSWRTEPSYGAVWVPSGVPEGWAPYSTGRWVADPHYGWTWVDTAPWGWAPYHYGRWVHLRGHWAWAPGPIVARPVYAPALVAFFGSPGVSVAVATPFVSWVALGWGEPVVPWWRASRFHGRPWWGGWGGPRVVNNVIVQRTTVIDVHRITDYRNARIRRAMVGVREDSFGRRAVHEARLADADLRERRPIHGGLHVRPDRSSFVAADGRGVRPAEDTRTRPVVTRRQPERGERPDAPRAETPRREPGRPEPDRRPGERDRRVETPDGRAERERSGQPERPVVPGRRVDPERAAQPERPVAPGRRVEPQQPTQPERAAQPGREAEPVRRPQPERQAQPVRPAQPERPPQPETQTQPVRRPQPERPAQSERPTQPERQSQPVRPVQPERPTQPERQSQPVRPVQPERRTQPERQAQPVRPVQPERPTQPERQVQPARPVQPERPTQPERQVQPERPRPEQVAPRREAPRARHAAGGGA